MGAVGAGFDVDRSAGGTPCAAEVSGERMAGATDSRVLTPTCSQTAKITPTTTPTAATSVLMTSALDAAVTRPRRIRDCSDACTPSLIRSNAASRSGIATNEDSLPMCDAIAVASAETVTAEGEVVNVVPAGSGAMRRSSSKSARNAAVSSSAVGVGSAADVSAGPSA